MNWRKGTAFIALIVLVAVVIGGALFLIGETVEAFYAMNPPPRPDRKQP